ncbi:hypothetical protein GCM10011390_44530 [Aureimonas endophytica]|uniref:Uncharacterized protein n=1 Tax=Aureimonas endophytica TaxID=2027858 RepID=A0A917A073_9HYPH|nr:hypothetical protein [Aureimonas endophytica]GGE20358.1 hypothetical protein GCM10011390_44530 [Aureimonas endophytica]
MTSHPATQTSCPVPLELLALLLRCGEVRLGAILGQLPDTRRAALAFYCFERYHLRRLGFAVAAHCAPAALEAAGLEAGEHLMDLARSAAGRAEAARHGTQRPALPRAA